MIRTLLRRHLRHQRVLIGFLIAMMIGFEVLIINIGSSIDRTGSMTDIIEQLPEFLQDLIKAQIGEVAFPAFPAFAFEHPATMGGALAYVVFLATIPAGERDVGLTDLFLARPLPRRHYLGATVVHLVATAVVIPSCLLLGTAVGLAMVTNPNQVHWADYLPAAAGLSSLLLAWGGIALLLGTGRQRRGATVVQMVGAILAAYLIHVLGLFSTALRWVEWISPFHYFHPIATTIRSQSCLPGMACLLAIFVLTTALALLRFEKRDI